MSLIEHVSVAIYSGGALVQSMDTDSDGEASFTLPLGNYTVVLSKTGYVTTTYTAMLVRASETRVLNLPSIPAQIGNIAAALAMSEAPTVSKTAVVAPSLALTPTVTITPDIRPVNTTSEVPTVSKIPTTWRLCIETPFYGNGQCNLGRSLLQQALSTAPRA